MKNRKKWITTGVCIAIVICLSVGILLYFLNSNRLNVLEKKWLDEASSSSQVLDINVINNAYAFGYNGEGVFFDLINDLKEDYNLNINEKTYQNNASVSGITFGVKKNLNDNDEIIYTDHYVLVGKNFKVINDYNDLDNILVLTEDISYITSYINNSQIKYSSFATYEEIKNNLNETNYAILPLHLYLNEIVSGNLEILYHFSDINMYYVLTYNDDMFSNILRKYYSTWKDSQKEYYDKHLFETLTSALNISEAEIDNMRSITYSYGFINNSPYEVISNGNYGGIVAVYLKNFSDFADVDFKFTRYRNFNKFSKAINSNKVDIYFDYYNLVNDYNKTTNGININYAVIANTKNDIVVSTLNSLVGKEVYVDKNSNLQTFLSSIKGIDIKTYSNSKELLKLNKKDKIILLDSNIFEYYQTHGLENYTIRYSGELSKNYGFKIKKDSNIYKLFNKYTGIIDSNKAINDGIYNHEETVKVGILLRNIAKYFIIGVILVILVIIIYLRSTKKVKISKKIKKDDAIRFIDQLTLLKNRNYLNENIKEWSNNTIYPQTIVVMDLNHLQQINDIEGYEEGDKQIKSAANALMKTQLDNSDIIRTDGNEFVVYMVGYSQKQVTNYIHKLNKELKKLPYDYGAEFGYSMIIDDIKTIEDALNEATAALKKQKEINESKN